MPTQLILEGKEYVVRIAGSVLDGKTAHEVCVEMAGLLRETDVRHFCLDLGAVKQLSAAALGSLVVLHRATCGADAELVIDNVGPTLYELFEVTGLAATNNRVQLFTREGRYLTGFGGAGEGPGRFRTPHGLATDSRGHLYVVDSQHHRVQEFVP